MSTSPDKIVIFCGMVAVLSIFLATSCRRKANVPFADPRDFQMAMSVDLRSPSEFQWSRLYKVAAEKFRGPFRIRMSGGRNPIILPPSYMDEIKGHKDFTFSEAISNLSPSYVSSFKPISYFGSHPDIFARALRGKMTQNLVNFTHDLSAEAGESLPDLFPSTQEWRECILKSPIIDLITRMSSRIFLGRNFKHRSQWHKIAATYTTNMFQAQRSLFQWTPWLQPVVHWFLPEFRLVKRQMQEATAMIESEIQARRERMAPGTKQDDDNEDEKNIKQFPDSLDWFEDARQGKEYDFVAGQLLLSVVAIDTTAQTLTHAILDIVSHPTLLEDIRKEIVTVVQEDNGLKKTTLYKAKLLDSAIKESQRLHPLDQGLLLRVASKDTTLSNGLKIPKSETIMFGPLPHFDPSIYPDPYTYDGYRFFKLRQQPGNESKWQLATTRPEHIGFGHGMHACPGRFLASNEMKIALMHLLIMYEWRLPDGIRERPKDLEFDSAVLNDPSAQLMYKSRVAEVTF